MRHLLSLMDSMYNSYRMYAVEMSLAFREAGRFRAHIDEHIQGALLDASKEETTFKRQGQRRNEEKVNDYKEIGAVGSNGSILPVNATDMRAKLNPKSSGQARRW